MERIKYAILTLGLMAGFGLVVLPTHAGAIDVLNGACTGANANTAVCKEKDKDKLPDFLKILVNTLLFILGAVSVVVIIIAGISYTTSAGDPELVKKAMNSLRYAVVGLVVALMAFAIVNFVTNTFN